MLEASGDVERPVAAQFIHNTTVGQFQRPSRSRRGVRVVGYHNDRPALLIEVLEKPDDLISRFRIEIAGRFVG